MKPGAPSGGRSLINIDLAPREAACGRAGPGHPHRGLIKLGSTAQPRHQGAADSGVLQSKKGPHRPGWSLLPGWWGQSRPMTFIVVQDAGGVPSNPLPPPDAHQQPQGLVTRHPGLPQTWASSLSQGE